MYFQWNEVTEETAIDLEAYNECLQNVQEILLYMKEMNPQCEEMPQAALIIVPVPKIEVKCELAKYEGTLRERCKMRKRTSRRRREFEAAKARQKSS